MSSIERTMLLPHYNDFYASISILDLPISASELHGVICGYLASNKAREGESYIRALTQNKNNNDEALRGAARAIFELFTVSQQQITQFGFEFQLLLPDDEQKLPIRARAFSDWCEGFTQGITVAGIDMQVFNLDDTEEIIAHMAEFANLDYDSLGIGEEDERALMEVIEYARMATLHIYSDVIANEKGAFGEKITH